MNMPHSKDESRILDEAALWVVRASEDDFSSDDRSEFEEWCAADPRHVMAFHKLETLWDRIPTISEFAARPSGSDSSPRMNLAAMIGGWSPRTIGLATAAVGAVLFFAFAAQRQEPHSYESYTTGKGQISTVTLADGSVVTLAPQSELAANFTSAQRGVELREGEAFFDVKKDTARPFIVKTDSSIVRVVGTAFNVETGKQFAQIAVLRGIVQVTGKTRDMSKVPERTLHRGDTVKVSYGSGGKIVLNATKITADTSQFDLLVGGWRDGWLAYQDAKLGDVIVDLNRYYKPGVKLSDPRVGEYRVTASFRTAGISQFVSSIDKLFPVIVESGADGSFLLRPAQ